MKYYTTQPQDCMNTKFSSYFNITTSWLYLPFMTGGVLSDESLFSIIVESLCWPTPTIPVDNIPPPPASASRNINISLYSALRFYLMSWGQLMMRLQMISRMMVWDDLSWSGQGWPHTAWDWTWLSHCTLLIWPGVTSDNGIQDTRSWQQLPDSAFFKSSSRE